MLRTGRCQGQEGTAWGSRLSPPAFPELTGRRALPADPTAVKLENFPIHAITGVLKQWLRELPEPLMTFAQYGDFLRAVGESHCGESRQVVEVGAQSLEHVLWPVREDGPPCPQLRNRAPDSRRLPGALGPVG